MSYKQRSMHIIKVPGPERGTGRPADKGGICMLQQKKTAGQENLSMEEYLNKRQKIRERDLQKKSTDSGLSLMQKSSAWMIAELMCV